MSDFTPRTDRGDDFVTPEQYPTRPTFAPIEHNLDTAHKIGRLMEAVERLKEEGKELRDKVTRLSEEVHGYKIGFRWVIGVCVGAGAFIGWAITNYIAYKKP